MARYQYGGQALIEGVLMRGRNALAVALRHPDGSIVWATERLDLGLRARRALKLPFLRGLVVLYDTLVTGTRWLVRSATLQALALEDGESGRSDSGVAGGASSSVGRLLQSLAVAFTGPALCAAGDSSAGAGEGYGAAAAPTDAAAAPVGATTTYYADPDATASAPSPGPVEGGLGKG
ncbi:MAG TPA: hypothetical protein VGE81_01610, partial [Candidatus Limnocylindrales bacterium]